MLVNQVITYAYNLSGIVSRQFETVGDGQPADGLNFLNDLLDFFFFEPQYLPYYTVHDANFVAGQEKYFFERLAAVETVTFFLSGNIRNALYPQKRRRYFGSSRLTNTSSLPVEYYVQRVKGGSDIYFYYLPAGNYALQLVGKFAFAPVALDTELNTLCDRFYQMFLQYKLAQKICDYYERPLPERAAKNLALYENTLTAANPPDLTLIANNFLQNNYGLNNIAIANMMPNTG